MSFKQVVLQPSLMYNLPMSCRNEPTGIWNLDAIPASFAVQ